MGSHMLVCHLFTEMHAHNMQETQKSLNKKEPGEGRCGLKDTSPVTYFLLLGPTCDSPPKSSFKILIHQWIELFTGSESSGSGHLSLAYYS